MKKFLQIQGFYGTKDFTHDEIVQAACNDRWNITGDYLHRVKKAKNIEELVELSAHASCGGNWREAVIISQAENNN